MRVVGEVEGTITSLAGPQPLGDVRWEGFTHHHMWNMIMDAHPDEVFARYQEWQAVGASLADANKVVQTALNTLFQTWEGAAAIKAGAANTRMLQWAQDASETTERIGEDLGRYGNALVEARKRMPQPRITGEQAFRDGAGATMYSGPENAYAALQLSSDHMATEEERAEARRGAIEVMRTFEAQAAEIDQRVTATGGYTPTAPAASAQATVQPTLVTQPPVGVLPTPTPTPPVGVSPTPPHGGGAAPAFTTPAAAGPGGAGGHGQNGYGPGAGGVRGHGPGSASGGAGGHGPGTHGAAGTGSGAVGGPGGRGGVGIGPGGVLGGAGAVGTGAAGARGAGGGFMPPMAGGAGRDDEREHRVAPYLVADDDLFDDERTVAPPVFGA